MVFYLWSHARANCFKIYTDILVLGDFNHDVLKRDNRVLKFLEDLNNLNIHVHSKHPTNFQGFRVLIFLLQSDPNVLFSQIDIPGIPTTHDLIYGSYSLPCAPDPTD
jgi:hypothetical protein